MTPNDSPSANKTSEAVENIATLERVTQIEINVENLVAIAQKYKRMEDALRRIEDGYAREAMKPDEQHGWMYAIPRLKMIDIAREALSFDPLND